MDEEEKEKKAEKPKEEKAKEEKSREENKQENIEFLRYLQEVEKFPHEIESLKTSIEANKSTVRLAEESISHFNTTRTDNIRTLLATLGVSILTLVILIVQTFSSNKTKLTNPIELESGQVQQIIKTQEEKNLILVKALEKNNLVLSSQVDSLKSELRKLNKTLNSINKKIK